jgi:hypothetical protein
MKRIRQLETLLSQVSTAPPAAPAAGTPYPRGEPLIRPEEEEEYGKEFFDVVGRRAREIVSPEVTELKKQVADLTARVGHSARVEAEQSRGTVIDALNEGVPGWERINTDQTFLAWLAGRDVFSGRLKRELLTEAFESNDAARVVKFFKAFQEDSPAPAPVARTPSVDAGTLVAPGATRSGAPADAPGGTRIWTQAEISQFYAAARQRKISPEEKIRVESEIIRAAAEGRVR